MPEKPKTKAQLQADYVDLLGRVERLAGERQQLAQALENQRTTEAASNKRLRGEIDDLKERLVAADAANFRLQGYLDRVREDDIVREELVLTGDPQGEQHLVPKRPAPMRPIGIEAATTIVSSSPYDEGRAFRGTDRPRRRHWVTYGGL